MTIEIDIGNGDYRVTSDAHNYILNKKRVAKKGPNTGQVDYVSIGFFPSLKYLVAELVEVRVRGAEVKGLEDLAEVVQDLKRDLWSALPAERRTMDRKEAKAE